MIPMVVPNLSGNERKYLNNCIDTTFVSSVGEYVTELEKMCAAVSGASYGVAVSCGTTGLDMALTAAGVGRDDLVIIPSYTFIATANAVAHCNAVPWLIDINENDWCMDAGLLRRELDLNTEKRGSQVYHKPSGRRVAAVMPVYVHGNIPDMDSLNSIACDYHLPLVADAACAIGAEWEGRKQGELAVLSVYSFNGNKTVTCGGGGAVVGNDEKLIERIRHLTTTARVWPDYDFDEVGYNYRMTNVQAAVGVAQMERVAEFVNKKKKIRAYYQKSLSGLTGKGVSFFPTVEGSSCWLSGIVLPEGTDLDKAKEICSGLKEKGIDARTFWKPVHLQTPYGRSIKSGMDNTDKLWQRIVTLPCSTNITDQDLETVSGSVIDTVNAAL